MTAEEYRTRLFGFVVAGAEEVDLPSFAAALDQYVDSALQNVRRYTELLEVGACQCNPEQSHGEYLHDAQCPVARAQMQVFDRCLGFEGNPVAPDMCAGCGVGYEDHEGVSK